MEQILRAHLLSLIAAFSAASDRAESTVAQVAAGDWRFFTHLRASKGFRVGTYDRVVAWFSANWPEGAVWPDDIDRPAPNAADELIEAAE
jgi:hypothetical protein